MSLVDRNSIETLTVRDRRKNIKILMTLTSHDVLGKTGLKTDEEAGKIGGHVTS
jgi:hypothetical protein